MTLDNVPILGDDALWKQKVEQILKAQAATIARMEGRLRYLEGRAQRH